jgi:aldose 1-epimerase
MPATTLSHGPLEVTFLPELGMVSSSLRHRGEELLELRGGPDAYAERGSSFGIPLLHPYANRLSEWSYPGPDGTVTLDPHSPVLHTDADTGLPSHGLLAASPLWYVTSRGPAHLTATLDFAEDPRLLAAFPYPHKLTYAATLTEAALAIALTVTPTGDRPVPISFGFHPYLRLPGAQRADWELTLPVARRVLVDHSLPTGAHEPVAPGALDGPLADRSFDDCFDRLGTAGGLAGPPAFSVAAAGRRITVTFTAGYPVAQLYAPPGSEFICIEPMTAPIDALRSGEGLRHAAPGEPFTAEFSITVQ